MPDDVVVSGSVREEPAREVKVTVNLVVSLDSRLADVLMAMLSGVSVASPSAPSVSSSGKAEAVVLPEPGIARDVSGRRTKRAIPQLSLPIPADKPPAVDPRESVLPDALICLEDGRSVTLLKRYIRTRYNLTPEQYRKRWGLPDDYPMVAPRYAMQRSDVARRSGLGRRGRPRRNPAGGATSEAPVVGALAAPAAEE